MSQDFQQNRIVTGSPINHDMSVSTVTIETNHTGSDGMFVADTLVSGLGYMLVANVIQRAIGFVRNIALCRFLADDQLGLWALASSFLILAAPFAVLGLPGTFGRLVEPYRLNGQLRVFLGRVSIVSLVGVLVCISFLVFAPSTSSTIIFGTELSLTTMIGVALALLLAILFNATTELLNGLRKPRLVSTMHTCNSLVFTVTSLAGMMIAPDWRVLIVAFSLAALAGLIPAVSVLRELTQNESNSEGSAPYRDMWRRAIPFAISVWLMNLLVNLFDVVDRYMLLYMTSGSTEAGRAIVGQFHSGRIMPVLLSSLTLMLSGLLLPYLAADWEAGRRMEVSDSLRLTFKCASLFFFGLSIASLVAAPFLFDTILQGKYDDGLAMMPQALLHCCVTGLASLMQNYFWCTERGRIVGFIIAIGLVLNVILNVVCVPLWGLHGAMFATSVSGAVILVITTLVMQRCGVHLGYSCLVLGLLPLSLLLGSVVAATWMAIVFLMIGRTNRLFSKSEKQILDEVFMPQLRKIGLRNTSLWPV